MKYPGTPWTPTAKFFHWALAAAVLATLAIGWWAEHRTKDTQQIALYEAHFSTGLATAVLFATIIVWRVANRTLPNARASRGIQALLAATVHTIMYGLIAALLISGALNFAFLGPVRVFGLLVVPQIFDPETQEPLRALTWYVHVYSYPALAILTAGHVAAAIFHWLGFDAFSTRRNA